MTRCQTRATPAQHLDPTAPFGFDSLSNRPTVYVFFRTTSHLQENHQ